jgi:hypothetical protein
VRSRRSSRREGRGTVAPHPCLSPAGAGGEAEELRSWCDFDRDPDLDPDLDLDLDRDPDLDPDLDLDLDREPDLDRDM